MSTNKLLRDIRIWATVTTVTLQCRRLLAYKDDFIILCRTDATHNMEKHGDVTVVKVDFILMSQCNAVIINALFYDVTL